MDALFFPVYVAKVFSLSGISTSVLFLAVVHAINNSYVERLVSFICIFADIQKQIGICACMQITQNDNVC